MRRIVLGPLHTPEAVVLGVRAVVALAHGALVALALAWLGAAADARVGYGAATAMTIAASWLATRGPIDRWVLRTTLTSGAPVGLLLLSRANDVPTLVALWPVAVAAAWCGLTCALLVAPAAWIARVPSHDSLDRVAVAAGFWIAGALGVGGVLDAETTAADAVAASGAAVAIIVGAARLVARRRWLTRVLAGQEVGLAALGPGSIVCDGSCLPLGVGRRDGYVARESAQDDGPFRGAVLRAVVAPLRAASHDPERGRAERGLLALAVAALGAALGALALTIVDETIWGSEYGPIAAGAYVGVALSTALLAVLVALAATYAPAARRLGRTVVLALPAGLLEGGIAVSLAAAGDPVPPEIPFVGGLVIASLVSIPSALVIGPLLAWMSARAAAVATAPDSRARAARTLAPIVLAGGVAAVVAGAWRAPAAVPGVIAMITAIGLLVGASDRCRAWAIRLASRSGRRDRDRSSDEGVAMGKGSNRSEPRVDLADL